GEVRDCIARGRDPGQQSLRNPGPGGVETDVDRGRGGAPGQARPQSGNLRRARWRPGVNHTLPRARARLRLLQSIPGPRGAAVRSACGLARGGCVAGVSSPPLVGRPRGPGRTASPTRGSEFSPPLVGGDQEGAEENARTCVLLSGPDDVCELGSRVRLNLVQVDTRQCRHRRCGVTKLGSQSLTPERCRGCRVDLVELYGDSGKRVRRELGFGNSYVKVIRLQHSLVVTERRFPLVEVGEGAPNVGGWERAESNSAILYEHLVNQA